MIILVTTQSPDDQNSTLVSELYVDDTDVVAWAVGCTLFCVLVFACATLQYFRKKNSMPAEKRRKRKKREEKKKAQEKKSIEEVSRDAIPAETFLDALKEKRQKGLLQIEFKALNRFQVEQTCEVGFSADNRTKNNYPEVLPYDHCRVVLDCLPGDNQSSDYINASYIDAYSKPKAYIAAQGPCRSTINDFWRMIWQENCHCIVMATNVFEHARQQCEKYWHNEHCRYGKIEIWLEDTDILADFNIRTFRVKKAGVDEERFVKQFQFASWSDHDCPNPSSVLEYRRRIKMYLRNKPGPILVHCGAGAGRTGTFIAIDAMLDRCTLEKTVDIFNYVLYLRECRQNMVRNLSQYEFIYATVAMFLQCGTTVITAKELPAVVQKLAIKDPVTKLNGFERELKTLQQVVPKLTVGECAGGHRAENRRKSRDVMMQPPERARPYLITHDSNESTDYINAVYVDGYIHTNAYIVTQWPMKNTIHDIWRLVYDYNVPSMVLLNDTHYSKDSPKNYLQSCPKFWPEKLGVAEPYGPLTVELAGEEEFKGVIARTFKIRKTLVSLQAMNSGQEEAAKTVKLFQLRNWPSGNRVPSSSSALIELLTKVEDWQLKGCQGKIPTCVISKNGVSRCGCYCAISIAWDKLKSEGEVDIFRAVKTVKMNRPQLVENMVEYIYCYTFMVILLELLNKTQPSRYVIQTVSEETTQWDNREKPVQNKLEKRRKGDDKDIPSVKHPTHANNQIELAEESYLFDHYNNIQESRENTVRKYPSQTNIFIINNKSYDSMHFDDVSFESLSYMDKRRRCCSVDVLFEANPSSLQRDQTPRQYTLTRTHSNLSAASAPIASHLSVFSGNSDQKLTGYCNLAYSPGESVDSTLV